MRSIVTVAALLAFSTPALAQTVTPIKAGMTVRDIKQTRLGVVDRVNADGSVRIIYQSQFITIPADKVVMSNGLVGTSLTKAEVAKLH